MLCGSWRIACRLIVRQPNEIAAVLAGLVALSAGVGCGGGGEATSPSGTAQARVQATPVDAPLPGKSGRRPLAPGGRNAGPRRSYSGRGTTRVGQLKLTRDAVLHWTVSGSRFALSDPSHRLRVSGRGRTGQGFAPAGEYRQVRVTAEGRWTLQVELLGGPG